MLIAQEDNPEYIQRRKESMESGEMLNNMNMAGTAIKPPRWKRKNFVESRRPSYAPPVLTDLGKKLAGLKKWHEEDEEEEAEVEMTDRGEDTTTSQHEEEEEEEKEKARKPKRKKRAKRRVLDEEPEEKEEEKEEKKEKKEKKQSKKPRMHWERLTSKNTKRDQARFK